MSKRRSKSGGNTNGALGQPLRGILDATHEAAVTIDRSWRIVHGNQAFGELFDCSPAGIVGLPLASLFADGALEAALPADVLGFATADAGACNWQGSCPLTRRDGQPLELELSLVTTKQGRQSLLTMFARDRPALPRRPADPQSQLAAEDTNRPLDEPASRTKRAFLANVSHELRTPMNAILGMLELSLDVEDLSSTVRDYLSTAHDSARVLLSLLNDLLDFSRTEAGTFELDVGEFQLRDAIDLTLRTLAIRAHEKGLEIACHVDDDVPDRVIGDARRLQQIIVNLVGNAIKFTDSGEVRVGVTLAQCDHESVELLLTVTDSGIGISQADQIRIFAPFTQADGSSTRKYQGTGLGLAITGDLARLMNGRLWVESKLGQGSRFYCALRFTRGREKPIAPAPQAPAAPPALGPTSAGHHRALRVLVAEDTRANQKVVKAILTKRGHSVEVADNGREAVDRVQKSLFDVVLMDAQMPVMNGLQATAAIRLLADTARARVPVIAMTAHAMRADRDRCLAAGMDDYLSKPIDMAELVERVEYHGARRMADLSERVEAASPRPGDPQVLDLQAALERFGGIEHILYEMIELFCQDAPALMDEIRGVLRANDLPGLARAAHNLRGAAVNFDAARTMAAATAVEEAADAGDRTGALRSVERLNAELVKLVQALNRTSHADE